LTWVRLRSEEDLANADFSKIKVLIVAGSFNSDANPRPYINKTLQSIYESNPHIKIFGFGAGAVLLAPLTGISVEFKECKNFTYIGRRQISLPDLNESLNL